MPQMAMYALGYGQGQIQEPGIHPRSPYVSQRPDHFLPGFALAAVLQLGVGAMYQTQLLHAGMCSF